MKSVSEMSYEEKLDFVARHAQPLPLTRDEVEQQVSSLMRDPLVFLVCMEDDLLDAAVVVIQRKLAQWN